MKQHVKLLPFNPPLCFISPLYNLSPFDLVYISLIHLSVHSITVIFLSLLFEAISQVSIKVPGIHFTEGMNK